MSSDAGLLLLLPAAALLELSSNVFCPAFAVWSDATSVQHVQRLGVLRFRVQPVLFGLFFRACFLQIQLLEDKQFFFFLS